MLCVGCADEGKGAKIFEEKNIKIDKSLDEFELEMKPTLLSSD